MPNWFKNKKKQVEPRKDNGLRTKPLEYECYSEVVNICDLKETLMKWHNAGFHPLVMHSVYVAAMPSDQISIVFGKRKANLV